MGYKSHERIDWDQGSIETPEMVDWGGAFIEGVKSAATVKKTRMDTQAQNLKNERMIAEAPYHADKARATLEGLEQTVEKQKAENSVYMSAAKVEERNWAQKAAVSKSEKETRLNQSIVADEDANTFFKETILTDLYTANSGGRVIDSLRIIDDQEKLIRTGGEGVPSITGTDFDKAKQQTMALASETYTTIQTPNGPKDVTIQEAIQQGHNVLGGRVLNRNETKVAQFREEQAKVLINNGVEDPALLREGSASLTEIAQGKMEIDKRVAAQGFELRKKFVGMTGYTDQEGFVGAEKKYDDEFDHLSDQDGNIDATRFVSDGKGGVVEQDMFTWINTEYADKPEVRRALLSHYKIKSLYEQRSLIERTHAIQAIHDESKRQYREKALSEGLVARPEEAVTYKDIRHSVTVGIDSNPDENPYLYTMSLFDRDVAMLQEKKSALKRNYPGLSDADIEAKEIEIAKAIRFLGGAKDAFDSEYHPENLFFRNQDEKDGRVWGSSLRGTLAGTGRPITTGAKFSLLLLTGQAISKVWKGLRWKNTDEISRIDYSKEYSKKRSEILAPIMTGEEGAIFTSQSQTRSIVGGIQSIDRQIEAEEARMNGYMQDFSSGRGSDPSGYLNAE